MDYFDRESRGSKNSKSDGNIKRGGGKSRNGSEYSRINEEGKEIYLNQNSSTAMGTNLHGQSLHIDIEGNLAHNQSLDMA